MVGGVGVVVGGKPIITLPPSPCWVSTRSFWCTIPEQDTEDEYEVGGLSDPNTLYTAERLSGEMEDKRRRKGEKPLAEKIKDILQLPSRIN